MSPDWLGASRRAAAALRTMLAARSTIAERVIETGTRGEGGDRTLEIDALAEEAVLAELQGLYDAGARFTVLSEEAGTVDFGGDDVLVVVDPIDGSLNAKRGLPHHCVSIAVAEGPTMADVVFGFVQDFGPDEEWVATRGGGATLNGVALDPAVGERRWRVGRQARARRLRVGRPALGAPVGRGARPGRAPPAGDRHDRGRHVPGRGRSLRRHAHAQGLPGGGRGRRAADRAGGRRSRRLHGVRGPARRAARPASALAGGGGALRGRGWPSWPACHPGVRDRLDPRRAGGPRHRRTAARG